MGVMHVLNGTGDRRVEWGEGAEAVREAERIFAEAIAAGGQAFTIEKGGAATKVEEFDPAAERIVIVPRMAGGSGGMDNSGSPSPYQSGRYVCPRCGQSGFMSTADVYCAGYSAGCCTACANHFRFGMPDPLTASEEEMVQGYREFGANVKVREE